MKSFKGNVERLIHVLNAKYTICSFIKQWQRYENKIAAKFKGLKLETKLDME